MKNHHDNKENLKENENLISSRTNTGTSIPQQVKRQPLQELSTLNHGLNSRISATLHNNQLKKPSDIHIELSPERKKRRNITSTSISHPINSHPNVNLICKSDRLKEQRQLELKILQQRENQQLKYYIFESLDHSIDTSCITLFRKILPKLTPLIEATKTIHAKYCIEKSLDICRYCYICEHLFSMVGDCNCFSRQYMK